MQHDARGEAPARRALGSRSAGAARDFATEEQAARREIIARSFSAQLEACAALPSAGARRRRRRCSRAALRRALIELLAHFPSIGPMRRRANGRRATGRFVAQAVAAAKATALSADRAVIDRLAAWLAERGRSVGCRDPGSRAHAIPAAERADRRQGGRGHGVLSLRPAALAQRCRLRRHALRRQRRRTSTPTCGAGAARFPHAMLATATHDHKRGEDVRARLAVLSECADEWANLVTRWIVQCRPLRQEQDGALIPRASDIAMLLQMIVGAWPLDLDLARRRTAARASPNGWRNGRRRRCAKPSSRPTGRCRTRPMKPRRAAS